jgi:hypothetical protein
MTKTTIVIAIKGIGDALPTEGIPVLVFHDGGVDRGCRYCGVWRHADYGEDQLYGVTHWADLPRRPV